MAPAGVFSGGALGLLSDVGGRSREATEQADGRIWDPRMKEPSLGQGRISSPSCRETPRTHLFHRGGRALPVASLPLLAHASAATQRPRVDSASTCRPSRRPTEVCRVGPMPTSHRKPGGGCTHFLSRFSHSLSLKSRRSTRGSLRVARVPHAFLALVMRCLGLCLSFCRPASPHFGRPSKWGALACPSLYPQRPAKS